MGFPGESSSTPIWSCKEATHGLALWSCALFIPLPIESSEAHATVGRMSLHANTRTGGHGGPPHRPLCKAGLNNMLSDPGRRPGGGSVGFVSGDLHNVHVTIIYIEVCKFSWILGLASNLDGTCAFL